MNARRGPTLEQLRGWRNPPQPDLGLGAVMGALQKDLRRRARTLGQASTAWVELVPPELCRRTCLVSLNRSVLAVRVEDASTREALARWLRGGGELALVRRCHGLVRVRLLA
jgi:hypothetical protein